MKRGTDTRVCVVGAGPSGITTIKALKEVGTKDIRGYDLQDQVGGNWIYSPDPAHSSVYETSHIISTKRFSQYSDYPMPEDWPDYPDHRLLLRYFQGYADEFGVTEHYSFNTGVESAEVQEDRTWKVTLSDGSTETFDYFVAANGHHWNPRWPDIPGKFDGEYMHSHYYRTHLPFRDKRVLIIGAGNSACDIAVDISRHASATHLSWRRGYYVVPKLMFGKTPEDISYSSRHIPEFLRKRLFKVALRLSVGRMEDYGLPKPDHAPTESHPLLNSQLLYHLRHGDIYPKGDIEKFDGSTVHFKDGSSGEYDVVIAGTGYKITFPFFNYLDYSEGPVDLYLKMFHPDYPSLGIIGLFQPQGCIWPISEMQGKLFAQYVLGRYDLPKDVRKRVQKEIREIEKKYLGTPRHNTEVDFHTFHKRVRKEIPK